MEPVAMNGDQAIAYAWKQIDPDVVSSYPITPQTIIVEAFSEYVADGLVNTEFVCAESEHSAIFASARLPREREHAPRPHQPDSHSCGRCSTSPPR